MNIFRRVPRMPDHKCCCKPQVIHIPNSIIEKVKKLMADIDTLGAALTADAAKVAKLQTDTASLVTELQTLQASNPTVDLTGVIAQATALGATLDTVDATEVAAETPATPPVTPAS